MNVILQAIKSLFRKIESRFNADMDSVRRDLGGVSQAVDGKMTALNPRGTGSFSMNRKAETPIGEQSHAEGSDTTASGRQSHAEGIMTTASDTGSHAEGNRTIASGHASHAECNRTIASGDASHAEGYNTTARGPYSHAEGYNTTARGIYSHSEGSETVAHRATQHVQGRFNVLDDFGSGENSHGKYAHIVGNGTDHTARSNAHTLDWAGLGWFAGGLKVGGTGQDDEDAVAVLTTKDMDTHNTDTEAHQDIREAITSHGPDYDEWDAALGDVYMDMSNKMPSSGGNFTGTVQAGDSYQAPGTALLRNSKLVSTDTTPTVNGEINWTYG